MRKTLLVLLVLLIGVVIAADRIGVVVAQNEIAKQVQTRYNLDHKPSVTIRGIPFLTQVIGGEYGRVDVNIGTLTQQGVTLQNTVVELKNVNASLSDVINRNTNDIMAKTAIATATVPYSAVNQRAPRGVTVTPDGSDLQMKGHLSALGISAPVTAIMSVQAGPKGLLFTPITVRSGSGPTIPLALVQNAFTFNAAVPNLPLGSRITSVTVEPDGLRVSATTSNVNVSSVLNAR